MPSGARARAACHPERVVAARAAVPCCGLGTVAAWALRLLVVGAPVCARACHLSREHGCGAGLLGPAMLSAVRSTHNEAVAVPLCGPPGVRSCAGRQR